MRPPFLERRGQLRRQDLALVDVDLDEVADAVQRREVTLEHGAQPGLEDLRHGQRGGGVSLRLLLADKADRLQRVVFRFEVVVEGALVEAQLLGHLAHADGVVAVGGESRSQGGQHLPAPRRHGRRPCGHSALAWHGHGAVNRMSDVKGANLACPSAYAQTCVWFKPT